jgi:hypothetical protein
MEIESEISSETVIDVTKERFVRLQYIKETLTSLSDLFRETLAQSDEKTNYLPPITEKLIGLTETLNELSDISHTEITDVNNKRICRAILNELSLLDENMRFLIPQ